MIGTTTTEFPRLDREPLPPLGESGHLVALAWVFDPLLRSILLVEHSSMRWSCPGGHVEPDEYPLQAARRELAEETGLLRDPVSPVPFVLARTLGCARSGPGTVHWAVGYLFLVDPAVPVTPERHQRARWFTIDELPPERATDIDIVVTRLGGPADAPRSA